MISYIAAVLAVVLTFSAGCAAQSDSDVVHVLPRSAARPRTPPPSVRANVDMVLVNVTVLDREGRAVAGLSAADFAVLDDQRAQAVRYLSETDEPLSLVVVLDASASMAARIEDEKKAFTQFLNESNPEDDIALIVVSDRPRAMLRFGDSPDLVQGAVDALQPDGETALWDAMALGLKELKNSRHPRKVMVVISDGGDNHSRYTESELRSMLKESDVEVYAIGLFRRMATRLEETAGPLQLEEVTSITGGRVFSTRDATELARAATQINHELRNQYVIGYYPSNRIRDGNWRKLKIHLTGQVSRSRFRLYARKGYYAPSE